MIFIFTAFDNCLICGSRSVVLLLPLLLMLLSGCCARWMRCVYGFDISWNENYIACNVTPMQMKHETWDTRHERDVNTLIPVLSSVCHVQMNRFKLRERQQTNRSENDGDGGGNTLLSVAIKPESTHISILLRIACICIKDVCIRFYFSFGDLALNLPKYSHEISFNYNDMDAIIWSHIITEVKMISNRPFVSISNRFILDMLQRAYTHSNISFETPI